MNSYLLILAIALIDLILQPLFVGWIWLMPIVLLYFIFFKQYHGFVLILATVWCDIWSGYPFGIISGAIVLLWLFGIFVRKYIHIPFSNVI